MQWLTSVLLAIQVISSLSIIVLVLLQQGKGADMGSSFGSGSAGSLFGASGAANFLSRTTKWAAVVFFASTIGLAYMAHHTTNSILDSGVMQGFQAPKTPQAPAGSAVPGAAVPGGAVPAASGSAQSAPASSSDKAQGAASVPSVAVPAVPQAPAKSESGQAK